MMAFPRVVQLDPYDSSRLVSFPLPELSTLWRNTAQTATGAEVAAGARHRLPSSFGGNQLDLHFSFNASATGARHFGIRVLAPPAPNSNGGVNITVSTKPGSAFATLGGGAVAAASGPHYSASRTDFLVTGNTIDLHILVDHGLVEIFAEGGRSSATTWLCAPSPAEDIGVEIFNDGPATLLVRDALSHKVASVNRLPWE
jgi:sucrose-6-phosphate hydrolase SacC (GH32 family)